MTHTQMFHKAENEDGYVSVIVHRERFAKDLKKMGFVETQEEATATAKPAAKPQERTKSTDK